MNLDTSTLPPENHYEDLQRPKGKAGPNAPAPVWFESAMQRINQSIARAVMFEQHEYLENRRLPHTLKPYEVIVKPHLLSDGMIVVMTRFPIASDLAYVVAFTPVFENGHDPMLGAPPAEDVALIDHKLFIYQERGRFAYDNAPVTASSEVAAELKRQAKAIPLRAMQFIHFTILRPQVTEAFDDPHGHLPKLQAKLAARAAARGDGPTPAKD